uniref:(northern house mosquito) hypothetical protein n=1 Tax=Culex pipiens TaxID=7175 RepID=A0A8D8B4T3_CULPI
MFRAEMAYKICILVLSPLDVYARLGGYSTVNSFGILVNKLFGKPLQAWKSVLQLPPLVIRCIGIHWLTLPELDRSVLRFRFRCFVDAREKANLSSFLWMYGSEVANKVPVRVNACLDIFARPLRYSAVDSHFISQDVLFGELALGYTLTLLRM